MVHDGDRRRTLEGGEGDGDVPEARILTLDAMAWTERTEGDGDDGEELGEEEEERRPEAEKTGTAASIPGTLCRFLQRGGTSR